MKDLIVTPFKVGLLVLVGMGAFVWMVGQVKGGIDDDEAGYRVYAIFDDVSGMAEKSRVVIAGITVGQIDKIELDGDRAKVWLLVNTPLKSDAHVAKKAASLLGEYYLHVTPGYKGTPLNEGDQITFVDHDTSPAELLNEMKHIVADTRQITASIRTVISGEEGEQRLINILENINRTAEELNRTVATNGPKIDRVFDNVVSLTGEARAFTREFRIASRQIVADAQKVTRNARHIVEDVREIVGKNSGSVEEGFAGVKGAVSRLQGALDKLDGTLDHAKRIVGKIDAGKGTLGKLINDDSLHNNVNELVEESGRFVTQLTSLQTIVAMRSEYYMTQQASKNYFTLKLQPKPDKYYMVQLVDDPRGRSTYKETLTRSTDSNLDPVVSERQTVTEDRFKFSLQFAKRVYFATGRVGIIENTGGLGLDLHLIDNRLKLTADLFDFDANDNPRVRLLGMYTFFTHLFVAGGIDDVWNDETRDFFVGLGLEFTDDDLKAIFTATPSIQL